MLLHVPYSHIFEHDNSRLIKGIAPIVIEKTSAGEEGLALYNYHESPAVSFYMDRTCIYLDSPEALDARLRGGKIRLLIREEDWKGLGGEGFFHKRGLQTAGRFETLRFVVPKG